MCILHSTTLFVAHGGSANFASRQCVTVLAKSRLYNRLKKLKESIQGMDVPETDFGNITKTPQLGFFDFRAVLNMVMRVSESKRAKLPRQATTGDEPA